MAMIFPLSVRELNLMHMGHVVLLLSWKVEQKPGSRPLLKSLVKQKRFLIN